MLKNYKCHKIVKAEPKSKMVTVTENGHTYATSQEGYRVIYEDGYESWSPKKAFEDGYDLIDESIKDNFNRRE